MKTFLWWLLGLGIVGGSGYYIYDRYGKQIKAKDACIVDLPEPNKTQVLQAIKDKNSNKLLTYAEQAETEMGWICAAKEMREAVKSILAGSNTKEIENKVCISDLPEPDKSQVIQAIKDINVGALTNYLVKAQANNWTCVVDEINSFIDETKGYKPEVKLDPKSGPDGKLGTSDDVKEKEPAKSKLSVAKAFMETPEVKINFATQDLPSGAVKDKVVSILKIASTWKADWSKFPYDPDYLDNYANTLINTYKAELAANMFRQYASQIRAANASSALIDNATLNWPGIIAIDDAGLAARARPIAFNTVKETGVESDGTHTYVRVLNGYKLPSVEELQYLIQDLQTLYGDEFKSGINELTLIKNTSEHGRLRGEGYRT